MSKEHLWSSWLKDHISSEIHTSYFDHLYTSTGKSIPQKSRSSKRQGDLITKKVRVVCKKCNNGWMSKLEERVKPILIPLLTADSSSVQKEDLSTLIEWIVMKILVSEHDEGGTQVTPVNERHEFYKNRTIPNFFRLYISTHNSDINADFSRDSTLMSQTKRIPKPPLNKLQRNIQVTSFTCGKLFILAFVPRLDDFDSIIEFKHSPMVEIWPNIQGEISWPTKELLSQAEMSMFKNFLQQIVQNKNTIYSAQI